MAKRFSHVQLVTFDLFNTLYTPAESIGKTYARPLWQRGFCISEDAMSTAFSRAHKEIHLKYPNYGYIAQMASREWWSLVIDTTWRYAGINGPIDARNELINWFNTAKGYHLFDDVPRVLKHLRRKGLKVGVISNMDEATENVLRDFMIRDSFDFVLKSVAVGVEKPDVRIFEMALAASNVPAYDALHVGDSETNDYLAAKAAGMQALLVDRDPGAKSRAILEPNKYILSLSDLLKLI